jgi:aryl-alcohol dehydrogenase-like predicted oxidoreductase
VNRHTLPQTDLKVSALCFGLGSFGTRVRDDAADRLLAAFFEAGGNFVDTAHCYSFWEPNGLGASERELGACLRRLSCRDEVVIGTKGGHPDMGASYPRPDRYLAPEVIASDLDESLDRLGLAAVDLYYLHRDDPRVPVAEVIDALNREIDRGRVRAIAASNWSVGRIAAANEYAAARGLQGFVASQVHWNLGVPEWKSSSDPTMRSVTDDDADWYAAAGLPVVAYSATANGFFAGNPRTTALAENPMNVARRARAQDLAARKGCTPNQIALAYLLHQPARVIPLFSTTRLEHLHDALGAVAIALTPEQVAQLRG